MSAYYYYWGPVMIRRLLFGACAAAALCLSPFARAEDGWAYRAWVAKAGRTLRAGAPLSAAEIERLAQKSPEEVVDALMADDAFADTVLDFNMYFLGGKQPTLSYPDYRDPTRRLYAYQVFTYPQAIASAQAVMSGGDYFTLLDPAPPRYVAPFSLPEDIDFIGKFNAGAEAVRDTFFPNGRDQPADKAAGCATIFSDNSPLNKATETLYTSGFFDGGTNFGLNIGVVTMPAVDIQVGCIVPEMPVETIFKALDDWKVSVKRVYDESGDYMDASYAIHRLTDIRVLAHADTDRYLRATSFDPLGFWNALPNSSTNYNRKRASYMLRTYFCDDLTPLGVVAGESTPHAGDAHASEPSCQACHYKLDPMAGFFKDYGVLGIDFKASPLHVFDDQATFTGERLAAYRASWPVTGYIRSTRDPAQNAYGENLGDLMSIIRGAPEVRQCLARRLAEYTLGRTQTFDGAWIEHVAAGITPGPQSSVGFKKAMKELVLSNTFTKEDAQTDQCYDFFPADAVPEVPCSVAHVIRTSCAGCHRGTDQRHAGLDLTHWQTVAVAADGTPVKGFPHLDPQGNQIAPSETFTRMAARLDSSDPAVAMPLMRDMPAVEKARLYRWVNELATGGAP